MLSTSIKESYKKLDRFVQRVGLNLPFKMGVDTRSTLLQSAPPGGMVASIRRTFEHHNPPIYIGDHMGTGGFADVYHAVSNYDGVTDFAIKILKPELLQVKTTRSDDAEEMRVKETIKRFTNESYVQWDLSKNLSDPVSRSVVHVYDHGVFDSRSRYHFILMERMGQTLRHVIETERDRTNSHEVLAWKANCMVAIARIIGNVHREGIFHRDIKPENILFTKKSSARLFSADSADEIEVKLGDFGTVRWIKSYSSHYDGIIIGSQFYLSPEQIIMPEHIDARTDIYSFGVVCYELLYGMHPKAINEHTADLLEKLATSSVVPQTPPPGWEPLHRVILSCMKRRERRFQSMDQVVAALLDALPG